MFDVLDSRDSKVVSFEFFFVYLHRPVHTECPSIPQPSLIPVINAKVQNCYRNLPIFKCLVLVTFQINLHIYLSTSISINLIECVPET